MPSFRTIVAAVDFSDTSCEVVRAALALARHGDGRVCLIHAVPHVIQTPWVVDVSGMDADDLQRQWVAEAVTQLADLAATLRLDPRRVSAEVVVGPAAFEIVRHANEHGADVLVLGSHGRGVIRRLLNGSVAGRVLREAACPVMFVPDRALAARGESPAAFDGRCIPALGVARRANTAGILPPRALIAGRLARLGATRHFHPGLPGAVTEMQTLRVAGC